MSFELPQLPYEKNALEPYMSAETFEFHYGKHHAAYVSKLNDGIKGTSFADQSLEDIIKKAEGGVFNNAAQHWNHSFFWKCLSPNGGGSPSGALLDAINRDFGSFDAFKKKFSELQRLLVPGWAWLVSDKGALKITSTANADLPMKHGQTALFTVDVWEHAYYIDYRNARPKFVETILDKLANWDFASKNLK
ncbi:MAG: superoxide dismutase [Myxococcales bacterium]|nr:MAG: superoxide dismutase [Myxococcales bacterium]